MYGCKLGNPGEMNTSCNNINYVNRLKRALIRRIERFGNEKAIETLNTHIHIKFSFTYTYHTNTHTNDQHKTMALLCGSAHGSPFHVAVQCGNF